MSSKNNTKVPRTKEVWAEGIENMVMLPFDTYIRKGEDFLKFWAETFGEDYAAEKKERQDHIDENLTIGIIEKRFPMSVIEHCRYLAAIRRLSSRGAIKFNKRAKGWRVKK